MKNLTIYLIFIFLFFGCTNNPKIKQENNEKEIITSEPISRNLKIILQEYLNTKLSFDLEKGSQFMHPIAWEILKLKLPEEKDTSSIKKRIREEYYSAGIPELNKEYNMRYLIGEIIDSLNIGNDHLFLVEYERKGETKYDNIYVKSFMIAITSNFGETWSFIGIDKDYISQIKHLLNGIYPENLMESLYLSIEKEIIIKYDEIEFIPTNEAEKHLQTHFKNYIDAFYKSDPDKAISYLYPGLFIYLQGLLNNEFSINEIKNIFKDQTIKAIQNEFENREFEIIINKILNKVEYKNDLIYVLSYSLTSGDSNDKLSVGGEAIAISEKAGKDWFFFEKDDETLIPILSLNYPNQIIVEILNYTYEK